MFGFFLTDSMLYGLQINKTLSYIYRLSHFIPIQKSKDHET